jgi:hypothetical protein
MAKAIVGLGPSFRHMYAAANIEGHPSDFLLAFCYEHYRPETRRALHRGWMVLKNT